jgi:hypothetical protein
MPKMPAVSIYIRVTDKKVRRYERVKTRNPQICGKRDSYCLLYYAGGKQKWEQVGQDLNEALRRQLKKQNELLLGNSADSGSDSSSGGSGQTPTTLASLRNEFMEFKRTTTKRDGTPLDDETIDAYEQQTAEFLANCRAMIAAEVTGMDLRRYMAALRARGMSHRSVCNNYASIATFLKFCGVDHKNLLPYAERPAPDDGMPEAYTEQEVKAFFAVLTEERHRLFFETC